MKMILPPMAIFRLPTWTRWPTTGRSLALIISSPRTRSGTPPPVRTVVLGRSKQPFIAFPTINRLLYGSAGRLTAINKRRFPTRAVSHDATRAAYCAAGFGPSAASIAEEYLEFWSAWSVGPARRATRRGGDVHCSVLDCAVRTVIGCQISKSAIHIVQWTCHSSPARYLIQSGTLRSDHRTALG